MVLQSKKTAELTGRHRLTVFRPRPSATSDSGSSSDSREASADELAAV
ncbi:MAG: hypothetical protein QOJ34_3070 [Pseudonocardiales bacterium]|jgi:hypothetical protein|nr:hypothetical protein [Pseudonocardiales bacterium]MDT7690888.1 hypothetical protein [Pseudonocardiales bacterium]